MADNPRMSKGQGGSPEWVEYLENALSRVGYLKHPATGEFGDGLELDVKQFQQAHNLNPDGIVGDKTWASLNAQLPAAADAEKSNTAPASSESGNEPVIRLNLQQDFPEIYALVQSAGFEDYAQNVLGIDPADFAEYMKKG
jgi:peptidoglycan hydrolase-like protein with peptidoglycan-binding domain